MPLSLTRRSVKGSALTAAEHDANLDSIDEVIDDANIETIDVDESKLITRKNGNRYYRMVIGHGEHVDLLVDDYKQQMYAKSPQPSR